MWRELLGMERLSRLELRILREVCDQLADPAKSIATDQLNSIKTVRHKPRRMGAYIYLRESAPSLIGSLPLQLSDKEELILAEVRSTMERTNLSVTTRVWCVTGTIFELAHEARGHAFINSVKDNDIDSLDIVVRTFPQLREIQDQDHEPTQCGKSLELGPDVR